MNDDDYDSENDTRRRGKPRRKNSNFKPESVGDYAVGYGRPPENGKIRPGETRAGAGRPKGSKNKPNPERVTAKILRDGMRLIKIKNGKSHDKIEVVDAVIHLLGDLALNGNQRALQYYLNLQLAADAEHRKDNDALFEAALRYKEYWSEKLIEAEDAGYTPPCPYPHPNDMHFDFGNRSVRVEGPINKEDADRGQLLIAAMKASEYEILVLSSDLIAEPDPVLRKVIAKSLQDELHTLIVIRDGLGIPWTIEEPPDVDYDLLRSFRKKAS